VKNWFQNNKELLLFKWVNLCRYTGEETYMRENLAAAVFAAAGVPAPAVVGLYNLNPVHP
jgi:hypothetical protein